MPSTRPVCAEPSSSSSACHETSSSSRAFSRTCVYLDWATTGSSRKLYMELMSKAPFAVLTDGKHYHQPRSSVLGCSSWGRIRRRRAIFINAARTLLPLWQLTNDGYLEVVENTPAECTRLRNDILNSNDGEPTPTDSKTLYDSLPQQLEELGSNSSHKIVTLKKRSSFLCRKFTGRPALSLSPSLPDITSQRHARTTILPQLPVATTTSIYITTTLVVQRLIDPEHTTCLAPTTLQYIRDLVEETIN